MADVLSREQRHKNMQAIKSSDTRPEIFIRKALHRLGYRYSLKRNHLPGKPDLVFPSRSKVLFVHGCFWHRHSCANGQSKPKTRKKFWEEKFRDNIRRDQRVLRQLRKLGWSVAIVWECQLKTSKFDTTIERVKRFLDG
ncbi:very short patch repair endonuclease [Calycomorphotria hydatis]|uniref:Very short patch repair endonuclease n=1 Tax=Calycomorphotria hydatis TaxID=2528027 RepID=A0A517T606_9PLAN|nr:very short patch repair endonuclease [Calycomorphotria hydatis]QDT63800.1 Very short patch repair protein [Calycomorphotria hydatis]